MTERKIISILILVVAIALSLSHGIIRKYEETKVIRLSLQVNSYDIGSTCFIQNKQVAILKKTIDSRGIWVYDVMVLDTETKETQVSHNSIEKCEE